MHLTWTFAFPIVLYTLCMQHIHVPPFEMLSTPIHTRGICVCTLIICLVYRVTRIDCQGSKWGAGQEWWQRPMHDDRAFLPCY